MPAGAKLLLLPQRAYVPTGTLRRAANYPAAAHSRSVEEIAKVLKKVGLGHLVEHLDEERPGIKPYRAGRNSAWRLRESSFTDQI